MVMKDLSKTFSATDAFQKMMKSIEAIRDRPDMLEAEKYATACDAVIDGLKKYKKAHPGSIAPKYIKGYQNRLIRECDTVDDIITQMNYSINSGKNHIVR